MRPFLRWTFLVIFYTIHPVMPAFAAGPAQADNPDVRITAPGGGEAVQGAVQIEGSANPADFFYYEVSFRYAGSEFDTWFVVFESFTPVNDGVLAEWDTFAITDGNYDLRLVVTLTDASTLVTQVDGVRVRNYSLVETSTPGPTATATGTATPDLTAQFTPSATPTETQTPTPKATFTPLPPNPAELRPGEIPTSLARGAAGVLAFFILIGLYNSVQRIRRR